MNDTLGPLCFPKKTSKSKTKEKSRPVELQNIAHLLGVPPGSDVHLLSLCHLVNLTAALGLWVMIVPPIKGLAGLDSAPCIFLGPYSLQTHIEKLHKSLNGL
jgi:hypothetical protein